MIIGNKSDALQEAVAALSSDAIKQLLLIKTSPSYTERLTHALQRTAGQEAKFKRYPGLPRCIGVFWHYFAIKHLNSCLLLPSMMQSCMQLQS